MHIGEDGVATLSVAIETFAGSHPEQAVFYPEDDRFLVERETVVSHFEVAAHLSPQASGGRIDRPAT